MVETLSVMLQVGYFKRPRANGSSGWRRCTTTSRCSAGTQVTVVIRFWILAGLSVAAGLGVFYAEWVAGS